MKTHKLTLIAVLFIIIAGVGELNAAQDRYYHLPLRELDISGSWPDEDSKNTDFNLNWRNRPRLKYFLPYAAMDNGQEAYIYYSGTFLQNPPSRFNPWRIQSVSQVLYDARIAIRAKDNSLPKGTIYVPKPDLSGMTAVKFTVPQTASAIKQESARKKFYEAMENQYEFLLNNDFTGAAWFRYRAGLARQALNQEKQFDANETQGRRRPGRNSFEESYSLFTGGRAVSENLQMDRTLQTAVNRPRTIDISEVTGITTSEINWKAELEGLTVQKDLLADYIPADQHAIFCPTFKEMTTMMDDAKEQGSPVKHLIEAEASDAQTLERYEKQMCLGFTTWSRFWGPKTIRGVAFTGSDPYQRVGSDSAVLFDGFIPDMVYDDIAGRQKDALKASNKVKSQKGKVRDVEYAAVISPDRRICSYLARINNVIIVTNSLAQLEKIVETVKGDRPSMASLDEYLFFRNRYSCEEHEQTAFIILTDAAIRRWCGPKWRIGAARRTVVAAVLSHLQAEYLDDPDGFKLDKAKEFLDEWVPDAGTLTITQSGITSSTYGSLRYMTPIVELEIDKISEQENAQYTRFRQNYQRQWQNFFDPIAICLLLEPKQVDVDMSIRPLIAASEYRLFMQVGGEHTIEAGDGDPHPESILQMILAIDAESEPVRMVGNFARTMTANQEVNALGWLGNWITIYADDSPFWNELSKQYNEHAESGFGDYMEANINRVPLAVALDVDSPSKLTMFLVTLRAFIQQTVPNMTTWETLTHKDQSYVRIGLKFDEENTPSVYYAVMPGQLILTLHEPLIHRALDRGLKTKDEKDLKKVRKNFPWLGDNIAVRADEKAWSVIEMMASSSYAQVMQQRSWNNLPILREWNAKKAQQSEIDFHDRYWHTILVCPGGGKYAWNNEFQTIQSSVFGHPAQPNMPEKIQTPLSMTQDAQFGITFEEDGLRAKMKIEREKAD